MEQRFGAISILGCAPTEVATRNLSTCFSFPSPLRMDDWMLLASPVGAYMLYTNDLGAEQMDAVMLRPRQTSAQSGSGTGPRYSSADGKITRRTLNVKMPTRQQPSI